MLNFADAFLASEFNFGNVLLLISYIIHLTPHKLIFFLVSILHIIQLTPHKLIIFFFAFLFVQLMLNFADAFLASEFNAAKQVKG